MSYCRYLFVWLLIPLGWTLWGGIRASTRSSPEPSDDCAARRSPSGRWVGLCVWPGAACPASRNRGAFCAGRAANLRLLPCPPRTFVW